MFFVFDAICNGPSKAKKHSIMATLLSHKLMSRVHVQVKPLTCHNSFYVEYTLVYQS